MEGVKFYNPRIQDCMCSLQITIQGWLFFASAPEVIMLPDYLDQFQSEFRSGYGTESVLDMDDLHQEEGRRSVLKSGF